MSPEFEQWIMEMTTSIMIGAGIGMVIAVGIMWVIWRRLKPKKKDKE